MLHSFPTDVQVHQLLDEQTVCVSVARMMKKNKRLPKEVTIQIVEALNAGERQSDVARKFGITAQHVSYYNKRRKNIR